MNRYTIPAIGLVLSLNILSPISGWARTEAQNLKRVFQFAASQSPNENVRLAIKVLIKEKHLEEIARLVDVARTGGDVEPVSNQDRLIQIISKYYEEKSLGSTRINDTLVASKLKRDEWQVTWSYNAQLYTTMKITMIINLATPEVLSYFWTPVIRVGEIPPYQ